MKVLLRENVAGLGDKDDIVDVKDGYGRNYLIPRGLAIEATPGAVKEVQRRYNALKQAEAKETEVAMKLADKINGASVLIRTKASDEGRLFGAVTAKDVSGALQEQLAVDIDKRRIQIGEPLKSLGDHQIDVKLGSGQQAVLTVRVQPE